MSPGLQPSSFLGPEAWSATPQAQALCETHLCCWLGGLSEQTLRLVHTSSACRPPWPWLQWPVPGNTRGFTNTSQDFMATGRSNCAAMHPHQQHISSRQGCSLPPCPCQQCGQPLDRGLGISQKQHWHGSISDLQPRTSQYDRAHGSLSSLAVLNSISETLGGAAPRRAGVLQHPRRGSPPPPSSTLTE